VVNGSLIRIGELGEGEAQAGSAGKRRHRPARVARPKAAKDWQSPSGAQAVEVSVSGRRKERIHLHEQVSRGTSRRGTQVLNERAAQQQTALRHNAKVKGRRAWHFRSDAIAVGVPLNDLLGKGGFGRQKRPRGHAGN
jgi:hypothetical protein